jgi:PAS domain S-box-containing protein
VSGSETATTLRPESGPADGDRLAAVRLLESAAVGSRVLRRLTDLATHLLGVEAAQVSLVGEEQTVLAASGRTAAHTGARTALTDSLCAVALEDPTQPLVVGDAAADPRVADRGPVVSGEVGSYLGVPLGSVQGHRVGVLCVYGRGARSWTGRDVALLRLMADSVAVELELSAVSRAYEEVRLRSELAIDAAEIGTFDNDLASGRLTWDERTQRLFGYPPGSFAGDPAALFDRVHPEDRDRVDRAIRTALEQCGSFDHEYRLLLPGGSVRWVQARGRVVAGADGRAARLVGAVHDTTRQRHTDAQVARVLEAMPAAFYSVTSDWRFAYVNAEAERLVQQPRSALLGRLITDVFPAEITATFREHYLTAVLTGRPVSFEACYPVPQERWFEVRAWPSPEGLSVYLLDVTDRHRAQETTRRAAERSAVVGRVTEALSSALVERQGADAPLEELVRAVVPLLGDLAIASLVGEDGRLHDIASWHSDPALRPAAARYAELRLPLLPPTAPLVQAVTRQEVVPVPDVRAAVGDHLPPGELRDAFLALAPVRGLVVPLVARGRTLGALSLCRDEGRPDWDADELRTVGDVAERVALALDSAALHEHERRMAAELQRSLLTDPPQPDHCQIAVRYVPAVRAAQVGGDWYDAFVQPDGATVLVIGDVVGHDTVAAAAMGQLRSLLRAIAYSSGAGPAVVLSDLDRTMAGLRVNTLATAAVARLEQVPGGAACGAVRLRWSSAGHPPLLVRHDDGRVEELGQEVCDLILGVDPDTARGEHVTALCRGATVLMYTDGLVESRDMPVDDGVARLRGLLAELGELPLEQLCDELVSRMRPGGSEDDVALVAVRLRPADGGRPA